MTLCPYCKEEGVAPGVDPDGFSVGLTSCGRTGTPFLKIGLFGRRRTVYRYGPRTWSCRTHGSHTDAEVKARFGPEWEKTHAFDVCPKCEKVMTEREASSHYHNIYQDQIDDLRKEVAALKAAAAGSAR